MTGNWNQSSKPSQPWQLKHIPDPHRAASASLPPFCLPVEGIHGADGSTEVFFAWLGAVAPIGHGVAAGGAGFFFLFELLTNFGSLVR